MATNPILFMDISELPGKVVMVEKMSQDEKKPEESWYLEHTTQGHNKYYEINIFSNPPNYNVSTRHGRIGAKGRINVIRANISLADAKQLAQSTVESKLDKGYRLKKSEKAPKVVHAGQEHVNSRFSRLNLE